MRFRRKPKTNKKVEWEKAQDIADRVHFLVKKVGLDTIDLPKLKFIRSKYSTTRSYARIWGLSRIWQISADLEPGYVIEVISEYFDELPQKEKDKVLLHELAHIPKNFTGSLLPHTRRGAGSFHDKLKRIISAYDKAI